MKRNPGNWLDFNANERASERQKREREREGGERGALVAEKAVGTFFSSVASHKNEIGEHLHIPWRLSPTDFDAKRTY